MKKNNGVVLIMIIFAVFVSCQKKAGFTTEESQIDENITDTPVTINNEDSELIEAEIDTETVNAKGDNITDFFYNEILNGYKDVSFRDGEDGVINAFGEPLKENRIATSFGFEGGEVVEIYELIYKDITHQYYVFESGHKLYSGCYIDKKVNRLKTINIGDNAKILKSIFSDEYTTMDKYKQYYSKDDFEKIKENISYCTNPVECEIVFIIKDGIIQQISCNFLLI
jgi:hypothetical protein